MRNNNESKWSDPYIHKYTYNAEGLLESNKYLINGTCRYMTTYQWEEKSGNVGLILVDPYLMYLGLPTLKSVEIGKLETKQYFLKIN